MERYFCNCLNVIINVNGKDSRESKGKDLVNTSDGQNELQDKNLDPFFAGNLLDVRLAISGIEVSQPALSKERCFGDWLVYTCLNCGLDTHAVHAGKGADRVLLSVHVLHGVKEIASIKESSSYSRFLQMKLIDSDNRFKNTMCHLTHSTMLEATEKINESCVRLIQSEEDAKNERIRVFTENENHNFREYRIKANRDKEKLARSLRDCDQADLEKDDLVPIFESSEPSYHNYSRSFTEDHVSDLPSFSRVPRVVVPGRGKTNTLGTRFMSQSVPHNKGDDLSTSIMNHNNRNKFVEESTQKKLFSENDDILFDMEGYVSEKECKPFFESDDESDGEATSLEGSGGYIGSSATKTIPLSPGGSTTLRPAKTDLYATSLPVPVPLFNNLREAYDPESDEELKTSPSLSKLALSFKQVARSMQDSTEMFGDLPPRRKGTFY